ncbi:MAG TPA: sigma 54-interacting transcriptional regulator [Clostridia bacterium]|nr:sigma 54-interacting transcriptional regulator [Clostridia bacterium]
MSRLSAIKETAQQVAEALASALGIEAEIVDDDLTIIAGTGRYFDRIGSKEERGDKAAGFIYGRVLASGMEYIVEDPRSDPTYDPSVREGTTEETAEVCAPIQLDGQVIGVMGLVAFDEVQRHALLRNKEQLLVFVRRMASLLSSKVSESEMAGRLRAVLESIHEGILAVDENGIITHCNSQAEALIRLPKEKIIGHHVSSILPGTPMTEVLKNQKGYVEREEIYQSSQGLLHFFVTARPIISGGKVTGVVASIRDIADVRRLIYDMTSHDQPCTFDDILGNSRAIIEVKSRAQKVARGNATILLLGESGTGKEFFARAIHYSSPRGGGPFITVNCGAIPDTLLESELFGYEGGAFTGARKEGKAGKFELANGGTIFLDEIGDLPLHLQVKLLHVLQRKQVERVGGNKIIPVDVRVIAATNKDLERMMQEGEFRTDLYFRLNVIPIFIPPLRERKEDIDVLVNHFTARHCALAGKEIKGVSPTVRELFHHYDWPGNVRELENVIEYAVNLESEDIITIDSIPPRLRNLKVDLPVGKDLHQPLKSLVRMTEAQVLSEYLSRYGLTLEGKLRAARALGISQATLYRKLRKLGLLEGTGEMRGKKGKG